jgi:hypothetical protein
LNENGKRNGYNEKMIALNNWIKVINISYNVLENDRIENISTNAQDKLNSCQQLPSHLLEMCLEENSFENWWTGKNCLSLYTQFIAGAQAGSVLKPFAGNTQYGPNTQI